MKTMMRMLSVAAVIGVIAVFRPTFGQDLLEICKEAANDSYHYQNRECDRYYNDGQCEDCYRGGDDAQSTDVYNKCMKRRDICLSFNREERQRCLQQSFEIRRTSMENCRIHE